MSLSLSAAAHVIALMREMEIEQPVNRTPNPLQRTERSTMAEPNNADIKKLTFERAIEEPETIVKKRLEEGKVPLEESVAIPMSAASSRGAAARSCCGRPRRGSRRSRWIRPASLAGTEPLDVN